MVPYLNSIIKLHPSRLLLLRSPTFSGAASGWFLRCFWPLSNSSARIVSPTASPLRLRFRSSTTMTTVPSSKMVVPVRDKIELTDIERKIFDRLLATISHFSLDVELRVAGGWVRDKLLGKDCYDIDIAIDKMFGSEFVDKVREYLETIGEEAQGVGVIARNPDQSKHLETARMRLFDLWIDFVNLRCEDYSDNSRIPTMTFGTAKEDAYRRDLTINSLFYNINEKSVEDLTGRGIDDLKSGKIVTPLPPKETFLDDPLRVLRAIRFGARFEFVLDEDLKEAAKSEEVKNALAAKISKERIGTEIELMISGNQPVKAMSYITDLTLFMVVFCLPPEVQPDVYEGCEKMSMAYLDATCSLIHAIGYSSFTDQQRRLALYAALFLPFREMKYKVAKGKLMPVVNYVFRESLKQKASDPEMVMKIHQSLDKFTTLIPSLTSKAETIPPEIDGEMEFDDVPTTSKLRISTGFLLRDVKDLWRIAVLISTLLHPYDLASVEKVSQLELDKRKDLFKAAEDAIVELGLDNVWDMKPLINGKEIINLLQLKSGGPLVREWQQKLVAWQLAHPTGTADECLDWMKETRAKRAKTE
ncbi:tRNA nucleotidyltransferase cca2 [Linum grandiflorum]